MKKFDKVIKPLVYSLFVLYLLLLIWVIIFKCGYPQEILGRGFSWEPMKFGEQIEIYMNYSMADRFVYDFKFPQNAGEVVVDVILNFILFMPLGILVPLITEKHKFLYTALSTVIITVTFELFQLFTKFGCFSFFDLFANIAGGLLGYVVYLLLMKYIKDSYINPTINITSIVCLAIFTPFLIFAIVYTSMRFDAIIFRFSNI